MTSRITVRSVAETSFDLGILEEKFRTVKVADIFRDIKQYFESLIEKDFGLDKSSIVVQITYSGDTFLSQTTTPKMVIVPCIVTFHIETVLDPKSYKAKTKNKTLKSLFDEIESEFQKACLEIPERFSKVSYSDQKNFAEMIASANIVYGSIRHAVIGYATDPSGTNQDLRRIVLETTLENIFEEDNPDKDLVRRWI